MSWKDKPNVRGTIWPITMYLSCFLCVSPSRGHFICLKSTKKTECIQIPAQLYKASIPFCSRLTFFFPPSLLTAKILLLLFFTPNYQYHISESGDTVMQAAALSHKLETSQMLLSALCQANIMSM